MMRSGKLGSSLRLEDLGIECPRHGHILEAGIDIEELAVADDELPVSPI